MIDRKKMLGLAVVCALGAVVLTGCGGASSSDAASSTSTQAASSSVESAASSQQQEQEPENGIVDLSAVCDSLLEANPISNQFEITAMNIEYDFGLEAEQVVSYKGIKSNDNGDAGLVLVIQPAEGKAEEICTALENYKQDQVAFYGNYAEFAQAQANVDEAIILANDSRVIMLIASNECDADLSGAADNALNQ